MSVYKLDGIDLDDPAGRWVVTEDTLLPQVASARNVSVTVPRRTGVIPLPTLSWDPFQVTVVVLVHGDSLAALDVNYQALMARVRRTGTMPVMSYQPPGGDERVTPVRLLGGFTPDLYYLSRSLQVQLVFEAPTGVWRDPTVREADVTSGQPITVLDGGAMPVRDALLRLTSITTGYVRVADRASGTTLSWTGQVPAGGAVLIDTAEWTAHVTTTPGWDTPTSNDQSAALTMSPGGLALTPDGDGRTTLTLTGCAATLRARRAW